MAGGNRRAVAVLAAWLLLSAARADHGYYDEFERLVVPKEGRRVVAAADAGTVTAADVGDGSGGVYQLRFITMDPGSLFLPAVLRADMVFFVHTGKGSVSFVSEDEKKVESMEVGHGDAYRLEQGTTFYIASHRSQTRERLRIIALFTAVDAENPMEPRLDVYSYVAHLVRGFDDEVLRMGFAVPREVVREIKQAQGPPPIVPYSGDHDEKKKRDGLSLEEGVVEALLGVSRGPALNKKKKKSKEVEAFNFYSGKPDVENCYGWSRAVTSKDLKALKGSNTGLFMVNLTTGSMMGPHWNPRATEIAVVIEGRGVVQQVCPTDAGGRTAADRCKNSRVLSVSKGDAFVVPRFRPMAQISFNNESFVFVGFSTSVRRNHPQFLAGRQSVLQVIGKEVLAKALGARNSSAVERLLAAQEESIILACTSCAEELERRTEEERKRREEEEREEQRKRQEEEERQREEERRRREEEERKRRQQEEERQQREEEEKKRREEEEQERKQREAEQEREEEEQRQQREQEEMKRREEEQEEEKRRQRREEEEEQQQHKERKKRQKQHKSEDEEWGEKELIRLSRG